MDIQTNLRNVLAELPDGVRLVAVSKFHPAEAIREAYEAGIDTLAEYRARKDAIGARIAALKESAPPPVKTISPAEFAAAHREDLKKLLDDDTDPAEKNHILRGFVRAIIFHRQTSAFVIQYYI